jgi:phosphatidylinositol glycan class M
VFDLWCGVLIYRLLDKRGRNPMYSVLWLLNPFVATISCRGNAEALLCLLVTATLYLITTSRITSAAVLFGLAVHTKIYPIIYAVPIWFGIDYASGIKPFRLQLVSWKRVHFGLVAALTFLLVTFAMYQLYIV